MEQGIKYVNLMKIGLVVIEIPGVENSKLAVPVNYTLLHHPVFLAADTRPCVLMSMVTVFTIVGRLDLTTEANCREQPNKTKITLYKLLLSF